MKLQKVISHPVHIVDDEGQLSPTALIPFCSVSDNYSAMGINISQFDVPVCHSFRPTILRNQLCYSVDLDKFKANNLNERVNFTFFIASNQEREFFLSIKNEQEKIPTFTVDAIGRQDLELLDF